MSSEEWTPVISRRRNDHRKPSNRGPPPPPATLARSNPFDISLNMNQLKITDTTTKARNNNVEKQTYDDIPVQSTGDNVPPPVNTFAEITLGKALRDNIKRCSFVYPTPLQRHAIPIVLAGRDLMARAQTGSGKTAAFLLPIISGILKNGLVSEVSVGGCHGGVAAPVSLILAPTRELACQIHNEVKKFANFTGVKIVVAYSGDPINQQQRSLNQRDRETMDSDPKRRETMDNTEKPKSRLIQNLEKGVDILIATPDRLANLINRERVTMRKVKYLTLYDADRMLDMGFEPQIRKFTEQLDMPRTGVRQTMLFTATLPDAIQDLASDFLSNYVFLSVGRIGPKTNRIVQKVEFVEDMDKRDHLMNILRAQKEKGSYGKHALMLVFVETKKGADGLEQWLQANGFFATAIHADKAQMERERSLHLFKTGVTPILVATDEAARGFSIYDVAHVINFDLPKSTDNYIHRMGRTGRAGKSGITTTFFNENNAPLAKSLVELMQEANQEVPDWLTQYAEKSSPYGGTYEADGRTGGKFGGSDYLSDYNSSSWDNVSDSAASCSEYRSDIAFGDANDFAAVGFVDPFTDGSLWV